MVPAGVRWNPLGRTHRIRRLRPFVTTGLTLAFGKATETAIVANRLSRNDVNDVAIGWQVGGAADLLLSRSWSVTVDGGYIAMSQFSTPIGLRDDYSGPQLGVSIGWLFGGRR
jgi:hypothetical protein